MLNLKVEKPYYADAAGINTKARFIIFNQGYVQRREHVIQEEQMKVNIDGVHTKIRLRVFFSFKTTRLVYPYFSTANI